MKTLASTELTSWLQDVYQSRSLAIRKRRMLTSFHHHVECLSITDQRLTVSRKVMLRIYRGTVSWWCQRNADLAEREWTGLRISAAAGIAVPKLLATRETRAGKAALIQYVPGGSLRRWQHMPAALESTAEALASVHGLAVPQRECVVGNADLAELLDRLHVWAGELYNPLLTIALQVAVEAAESTVCTSQILHGDFHSANVSVGDRGVHALLDWEELAVGDPRWDVVTMLDSLGWDSLAAKRFLNTYEATVGHRLCDLSTFRGIKMLRNLIVAQWVLLQSKCGNPMKTNLPMWHELSQGLEYSIAKWLSEIALRRAADAVSSPVS